MIDISKFDRSNEEDEELYGVILDFNRLYKKDPNKALQYNYTDLYIETGEHYTLALWRKFYQDKRVRTWYSEELELAMDAKIQKLVQSVGENHSTATNQTLTSLIKYKQDNKVQQDQHKYFIYTSIPLTSVEEHLKNVKIIENIPKEIATGIRRVTPKRDT